MAKRGRKPKEKKDYFGEEEEKAVIEYINAVEKSEKERIYNQKLKYPFEKMIESIIRRYHLYLPDESSGDTFNDTASFLITKLDKFKPETGKKAFSYYGTICKNHVIGRVEKYVQNLERNLSYDYVPTEIGNNIKYSDEEDRNSRIARETIDMLVERIKSMINDTTKKPLKENEIKLGKSLINLFENWDFVLSTDGSKKLNKNAILFFLRESTGLDTKGVRDNMKKFKNEFIALKKIAIS